jgi:phage shock protein C
MEYRKLYRSRSNKIIGGVAGGLGDFFMVDPVIIRVVFVLLTIMGGSGIFIYLLLLIFIPVKPLQEYNTSSTDTESQVKSANKENEEVNKCL